MHELDKLLAELRRAQQLLAEAVAAVGAVQHAAQSAQEAAESEQLEALHRVMRPGTPVLVPDHVPEEWTAQDGPRR